MHHQDAIGKFSTVSHKHPIQHIRRITLQPGIDFGLEIQMVIVRKKFNFQSLSPLQNL